MHAQQKFSVINNCSTAMVGNQHCLTKVTCQKMLGLEVTNKPRQKGSTTPEKNTSKTHFCRNLTWAFNLCILYIWTRNVGFDGERLSIVLN